MKIRFIIPKIGLFVSIYLFVLGIPFLFGYLTKSWFHSTIFMFALASSAPFILRYLMKKVDTLLLIQHEDYARLLLESSKELIKEHDIHKISGTIVSMLQKTMNIQFVAILLQNKAKKKYELTGFKGEGSELKEFKDFPLSHPLISFLKLKKTPLLFEKLPNETTGSLDDHVQLIVPSFFEKDIRAILILGSKNDKSRYSEEDLNLLSIISNLIALAIENAGIFQTYKETEDKIAAAQKLVSIGGMAGGVVHQIKNRLTQFILASDAQKYQIKQLLNQQQVSSKVDIILKSLMQLAEAIKENAYYTLEIINGLLNFTNVYSEGKTLVIEEISLLQLIDLVVKPIEIKHELFEPIPLELDIPKDDKIYGIKVQLMETLFNLLDNSYEAIVEKIKWLKKQKTGDDYIPSIILKLTQHEKTSLLEISDNGIGIREECKKHIFQPFFTTKKSDKHYSGAGIGVYVIKRIIEEYHKGKIWFQSKDKVGTIFYIELNKI